MKVRPLFKRYLVFHMPVRRKLKGSSLYTGNPRRGSFSQAEEIWILEKGAECTADLKLGDHCWLYDAFELTDCELDLWQHFKDLEAFKPLKRLQEEVDGVVETKLVLEDSILAVDPSYKINPVFRPITWQG